MSYYFLREKTLKNKIIFPIKRFFSRTANIKNNLLKKKFFIPLFFYVLQQKNILPPRIARLGLHRRLTSEKLAISGQVFFYFRIIFSMKKPEKNWVIPNKIL